MESWGFLIGVAGSDDLRTQLFRPGSSAAYQKMTVEWKGPVSVAKMCVCSNCLSSIWAILTYMNNPEDITH